MEQEQTAEGHEAPGFDPREQPVRLCDDQSDVWMPVETATRMTFPEAVSYVLEHARDDGERKDVRVDQLGSWRFAHDEDGYAVLLSEKEGAVYPLRYYAFGQLAAHVGGTRKYLGRLPARLSSACINWGLGKAPQRGMLRLAGDEIRALVGPKYAALDDDYALSTVEHVLRASGVFDQVVVRSIATGLVTVVRLSFPSDAIVLKGAADDGDVVEIGIDIVNGEVSNRSLSATPIAWRAKTTGVARATGKRVRHFGDPLRLSGEFEQAIPRIIADARSLRERIQAAVDVAIKDTVAEFEKLPALGLTQAESREVVRTFAEGRGLALPEDSADWPDLIEKEENVSAFAIFEAITGLSLKLGTERRLNAEDAAGKYVHARVK